MAWLWKSIGIGVTRSLHPYVEIDGNGYYDPTGGDYPAVPGDQALWFVFNDVGNIHSETGSLPLGIEVRCMAYAFKGEANCLSSTTFLSLQH
jgi:hypothetical protein